MGAASDSRGLQSSELEDLEREIRALEAEFGVAGSQTQELKVRRAEKDGRVERMVAVPL